MLHGNLTIVAFRKQKSLWLIVLFTITYSSKDSDDEVATEQLTAVVGVTFMPHGDLETF